MKTFALTPKITVYDRWQEWLAGADLGPRDVILTAKALQAARLGAIPDTTRVICIDDFGAGEPTDEMIDAVWDAAARQDFDRVVGLGGGSVLDIAKILTLKRSGRTLAIFQKTAPAIREKSLVLIPTTCGTGSEVTNISIVAVPSLGTKIGLAVPELLANEAVVCPELLHGLPEFAFVTSGIDALVHAIESYLAPRSHEYPELYSTRAIELLLNNLLHFVNNGRTAAIPTIAREMLLGSNYAGIAFGNTGVGAVHAISYPLSGTVHIPHGEANSRCLCAVLRAYKRIKPDGKIRHIEKLIAKSLGRNPPLDALLTLEHLIDALLPKKSLTDYGMRRDQIPEFAKTVINTQQRLLGNNYVPLDHDQIAAIYAAIL